MKRTLSRLAVILLLVPLIFQANLLQNKAFAVTAGIADLNDCAQFSKDAVTKLVSEGIIAGDTNHRFNPKGDVTRAQVITFIVKILGLSLENPSAPTFKDVTKQHWSYQYIETAYKYGITAGTSPTAFSPDRDCTREELVTMLIKANRINPEAIGNDKIQQILGSFKDSAQISPWAKDPMAFAYSRNIIAGYNSMVTPKNYATREQTAVILNNFLTRYVSSYGQSPVTVSDLSSASIDELKKSIVKVITYDSNGNAVAQGSGFCISAGLFLTNYHVVQYGYSVKIVTDDGTSYDTSGIAVYDSDKDLAVLKTKALINVSPLSMGSVDTVSQGDSVVAIGSPYGLSNTVSDGIVSAIRQDGASTEIQTTAPITHGSSGGPLFDMQGRVIGITYAGYDSGNLNFAIPIDDALDWISSLRLMTFDGIPCLDMATDRTIADERNNAVIDIRNTVMNMFYALGKEDVQAFKSTLASDNPAYSITYMLLDPLFESYDLNYHVAMIQVTNLTSNYAEADVTYDISRVSGPAYRDRKMLGKYSLEKSGDQWLITSFDDSVVSYTN